jgi:hypothetical protein
MWLALLQLFAAIVTNLADLFIREAKAPMPVDKAAAPDPGLRDYLDRRVQDFGDGRGTGGSGSARP